MAKGRKHYSGKELIVRRQMEREREKREKNPGNRMTQTLKQINQLRQAVMEAKKRMREVKDHAAVD